MWHPQNISSLLLNSGEDITLKVLVSKAINNRFTEVVCIAHHLLVVSDGSHGFIHWSHTDQPFDSVLNTDVL